MEYLLKNFLEILAWIFAINSNLSGIFAKELSRNSNLSRIFAKELSRNSNLSGIFVKEVSRNSNLCRTHLTGGWLGWERNFSGFFHRKERRCVLVY